MFVKAWSSKASDIFVVAGAGVEISAADRAKHFERQWTKVELVLDNGQVVLANITSTFWTTCPELRSAEIGRWMVDHGIAPWLHGRRPTLTLTPLGGSRFKLERQTS